MILSTIYGGCPIEKAMPIIELISTTILGIKSNPLNLQTERAVKPVKSSYPPPNAAAMGIFNRSCGCAKIFSNPTATPMIPQMIGKCMKL
jgi:hypothetical protein